MIDQLTLITGIDIPFPQAGLSIHQPTLKEIGFVNESNFFSGCSTLTLTKEQLKLEDKIDLASLTNFDIIMSMIEDKRNPKIQILRAQIEMVLALLFPDHSIRFKDGVILLLKPGDKELHFINKENFDIFVEILKEMFCLKKSSGDLEYNPQSPKAKAIAEKLKKGRQKAAAIKGEKPAESASILSRYISILSIGGGLHLTEVCNYTIYQIFDQIDRYELWTANDIYFRAKMAGCSDLQPVDNWMKDIHS